VSELLPAYPSNSWPLNRELSRILLYLKVPGAVHRTVQLLTQSRKQEEQLHYLALLRHVITDWSSTDRTSFFNWWHRSRKDLEKDPALSKWFAEVGRAYVDGAWIDRYISEFRTDALKTLTPEEKQALAGLISKPIQKATLVPSVAREFQREWKMEDFLNVLDKSSAKRNLQRGRQAFVDAQCLTCHRFGNDGGIIGPELTAAGIKYDNRSLLESVLEPSKVINEQYAQSTILLKDGEISSGRIISQNEKELQVETDALSGRNETIARNKVEKIQPSTLSPMPGGLVNVLSSEEILDLLAYIRSGTNATPP
jgi:putative heme-binding domain-containing protein